MERLVLLAVIILATGIGILLIRLLNAQHDARIEAYRFSDPLPRPPGLPRDSDRRAHHTHTPR
ncbi:hypothetical protein [Streptomyces yangpuensis]